MQLEGAVGRLRALRSSLAESFTSSYLFSGLVPRSVMSRVRRMGLTPGEGRGVRRGDEGTYCFSRAFVEVARHFSCVASDIVKVRCKMRSVGLSGLPGLRESPAAREGRGRSFYGCFPGSPDIRTLF